MNCSKEPGNASSMQYRCRSLGVIKLEGKATESRSKYLTQKKFSHYTAHGPDINGSGVLCGSKNKLRCPVVPRTYV
jgi:hypothetical protein